MKCRQCARTQRARVLLLVLRSSRQRRACAYPACALLSSVVVSAMVYAVMGSVLVAVSCLWVRVTVVCVARRVRRGVCGAVCAVCAC